MYKGIQKALSISQNWQARPVAAHCLGFDLSGEIVLIKSEILITATVVSRACWWPGGTGHFRTFWCGDVSLRPLAYTRAS